MKSTTFIDRFRAAFNAADKSKNTVTDIIVYNITVDGAVAKSFGYNLRDFVFLDEAVTDFDIDITIDDNDFVDLFTGKTQLVDLKSQGKIQVKGNLALLSVMDERRKPNIIQQ